MKHILKFNLAFLLALIYACNDRPKEDAAKAEKTSVIFPKGDKNRNDNFKGEVWVKSLVDADSLNENAVGNVTFAPGARSKWHSHPAGQILLATDGVGYYQEKGQQKVILRKGDVIKCPPNTPHWHGASQDTAFVQVAITGRQNGPTIWYEEVTDEEYKAVRNK
ncbi:cupin domain-containing protein [Pedobacter caeni]|uniref:Cupin domain protein n=1 Tax=Pedobacter caeni TaxID=288992 RepID=A0A1M4UJN9_9SPHI|nr:cupin domain-containing protein [Pedobacter caeni]SHE56780.1 Cupin domain protein [Pedobacter caeni]